MTTECPMCGSTYKKVIMWDGIRSGGTRTTCAVCGHVFEAKEYHADENTYKPKDGKKLSWMERKASREY